MHGMISRFCLLLVLSGCCWSTTALESKKYTELARLIDAGDTVAAGNICAETVISAENIQDSAMANITIALLSSLDMDPEAAEKAETISMFLADSEDPAEHSAGVILAFLAGKLSSDALNKQLADAPDDFKAVAAVAEYIRIIRDQGVMPTRLNTCVKQYIATTKQLPNGSWPLLWRKRIAVWHNALQGIQDKDAVIEKLVAKVIDDALSAPARKQIDALNSLISMMLQNKQASAIQTKIRKAAEICKGGQVKPFTAILDYLSGKNKSVRTVYKETRSAPEFFLLASVAAFTKELYAAEKGKLQQEMLSAYLDNFTDNAGNTEQKNVLKWKIRVAAWQKWCSTGFHAAPGLEPLLLAHSKAIAEREKEKRLLAERLKLYEKLKNAGSLHKISVNDYKTMRQLFKDRPELPGLNFRDKSLNTYLNHLPFELQQGEWGRIRYLQTFKSNMIKNLVFSQFSGNIKLKKGTVKGQVLKADDQYITIKTSRKKNYKWSEIAPEQYVVFAESYVKNNIGGKVKGRQNIFSSKNATNQAVSKEYRLLAVFCDWYGLYHAALKFAAKAESFNDKGTTRRILFR